MNKYTNYMNNYTRISDTLLQNTRLKLSSRVIYARLAYRMNLSVANGNSFYDSKGQFHYVVYKINDLAHDCGLGRNTVINSLKELVDNGLIIKHRLIHLVRLELPKFHLQTPKSLNHKLVKRIKTKNKNNFNTSINTQKLTSSSERKYKFRRGINCWFTATNARLHKPELVRAIGQLANKNPKQAHRLFRIITMWRKKTLDFFNINYRIGLEDINGLTSELDHIYEYQLDRHVHTIKKSNYIGYIVNSLKRFFLGYFYNLKYGNKKLCKYDNYGTLRQNKNPLSEI